MSQDFADRLERNSLAEQPKSQSVSQSVRAAARRKEYASTPRPGTKCVPDSATPERAERHLDPEKQVPIWRCPSVVVQVVVQRGCDLVG